MPREEQVDMISLLASSRPHEKRFTVSSKPSILPQFMCDAQLLRFIHRNAISNACKYGKAGGQVVTELQYDSENEFMTVNVINLPGDGHEALVELGDQASQFVFKQGHRLHGQLPLSNRDDREISISAGDGAWIMKKCATILGGDIHIAFNPNRTISSLSFPVKPISSNDTVEKLDPHFLVPASTVGIAIDDSKVQRKLLYRLFEMIGIQESNRLILGANTDEIIQFSEIVQAVVEEAPTDAKILIIADEHLDIVEANDHHRTISGSMCVQQLREDLSPEDEQRILTLVRSANDTKQDVATFLSRTHGFLPKTPIRREKVRKMIQPLWNKRFSSSNRALINDNPTNSDVPKPIPKSELSGSLKSSSIPGLKHALSSTTISTVGSVEESMDDIADSGADLQSLVTDIDILVHGMDDSTRNLWLLIQDKLQVLKGDMMTLIHATNPRVTAVMEALEDLREERACPSDFGKRWKLMRALILSLV